MSSLPTSTACQRRAAKTVQPRPPAARYGKADAIGIGAGLALAPTDSSVEKVASPPIPDDSPDPPGILQVAPGAPPPGPVLGPAVPIRQLTRPKTEEPLAAPLPKPPAPTAPPSAEPAAANSPCYHVPCRRGLFRKR